MMQNNGKFDSARLQFQQKNFLGALNSLNELKEEYATNDLLRLNFEFGYLELLVLFALGEQGSREHFNQLIDLVTHYLNSHQKVDAKNIINLCILVGEAFLKKNEPLKAIEAYKKVVGHDPMQSQPLYYFKLFNLFAKNGQYHDAIELSKVTIGWKEFYIPTLFVLLDTYVELLDKKNTMVVVNKLAKSFDELDLNHAVRLMNHLILMSEYSLAEQLMRRYAERPNVNQNPEVIFQSLFARVLLHKKDYQGAINLMKSLKLENSKHGAHILARAYEKLKDYDSAFTSYTTSAQRRAEDNSTLIAQGKQIDYVHLYNNIPLKQLSINNSLPQANTPAFMLGFPRSGTTLLDNVLDSHDNIRTISEKGLIYILIDFVEKNLNKKYPQCLSSLTEQELVLLRDKYYELAATYLLVKDVNKLDGITIVEKMPLYTIHIPFIIKLFPKAKFLFSIRHPMDCVLSSFQQNLVINSEMSFLSTLDTCTKRYIDVLTHFEKCESAFNLNIHFVRYEQLVTDFKETSSRVLEFLNMDTTVPIEKTFYLEAKNKIINTPSNDQVSQPIYLDSIFKWKNYEKHLGGALKALDYFIRRFNYSV
ncbi:tetratricopeptide repeat-containing sulfotransferase family protein [Thalassotalea ganghwensis]